LATENLIYGRSKLISSPVNTLKMKKSHGLADLLGMG